MEHDILLISAGIFHPSLKARYWFKRALPATGFNYERHSSLEILQTLELQDFSAIMCYFHHKVISQKTLQKLNEYVHNGGGVFFVHSASASFKDVTRFHNLIGGRFDRHGPIEDFRVIHTLDPDPIFPKLEPFSVRDELYMHVYDPTVTIHFGTQIENHLEPVVWTKQQGNGRVCYLSLGHLGSSFQIPQVKSILQHGLNWLCQTAKTPGELG